MQIVIMAFLFMLCFLIFAIAVADYVLKSLALYTLAKRRNVANPWLAWIPVGTDWIIGSLADEIDSKDGKVRSWGKTLVSLSISVIAGIVFSYALIIIVGVAATFIMYMQEVLTAFVILVYVLMILISVLSMAYALIGAICIYKIFDSTVPEKTVKYLVLYYIVPLAGAICLYKCKDAGYPQPVLEENVIADVVTEKPEVTEETENKPQQNL